MHKNAAPFAIRVARKFSMVSGADFGMCILVVLLQAFALLWFVQAGTGDIQPENATQEGRNRTGHSREVSATERYGKVWANLRAGNCEQWFFRLEPRQYKFQPLEEMTMANVPATDTGHPEMDYPEHERTYVLFIGLVKWVSIASVGIMVLLALMTL